MTRARRLWTLVAAAVAVVGVAGWIVVETSGPRTAWLVVRAGSTSFPDCEDRTAEGWTASCWGSDVADIQAPAALLDRILDRVRNPTGPALATSPWAWTSTGVTRYDGDRVLYEFAERRGMDALTARIAWSRSQMAELRRKIDDRLQDLHPVPEPWAFRVPVGVRDHPGAAASNQDIQIELDRQDAERRRASAVGSPPTDAGDPDPADPR